MYIGWGYCKNRSERTKRGLIGETADMMLCDKAQKEFNMACKARTVSYSLLYGGKMAAALSRQHPRDLFDCKYMEKSNDSETKPLLFCRDTDPG